MPFGYAYGALVFTKKSMDKLPPQYREMIKELARKHFSSLRKDTRESNQEALKALRDTGIKIIDAKPSLQQELLLHRDNAVRKTIGNAYSKEIYDQAIQILDEFRQTAEKKG